MKRLLVFTLAFMALVAPFTQMAPAQTTLYVATNGTGGGTSWADATNSIQGAIDASSAADTVLVSNGVYEAGGVTNWPAGTILTNRVAIYKAIIVQAFSTNPSDTVIKGAWDPTTTNGPAAVRCVYMTNGSSLIGFTLTNGATLRTNESSQTDDRNAGGVYCQSNNAVISNCIIAGNSANLFGGGAANGRLFNCTLSGNKVLGGYGGGAQASILSNCTLSGNSGYSGGGAGWGSTLYNCTLTNNWSVWGGGASYSTLYNCTLSSNSSSVGGVQASTLYNCILTRNDGGGGKQSTLYNCLLTGNSGSEGGGANQSTLYNCTVIGNYANVQGGGVNLSTLYNCIVYFNSSGGGALNVAQSQGIIYSCTIPSQSGDGNITNNPSLINPGSGYGLSHVAGNYRLSDNSPAIKAGTNFSWMTVPTDVRSKDLDGQHRIDNYNWQVDMGCYEYFFRGTIFVGR